MNYEAARTAWKRRFKGFDLTLTRLFVYHAFDLPTRLEAKDLNGICEKIINDKGFYIMSTVDE